MFDAFYSLDAIDSFNKKHGMKYTLNESMTQGEVEIPYYWMSDINKELYANDTSSMDDLSRSYVNRVTIPSLIIGVDMDRNVHNFGITVNLKRDEFGKNITEVQYTRVDFEHAEFVRNIGGEYSATTIINYIRNTRYNLKYFTDTFDSCFSEALFVFKSVGSSIKAQSICEEGYKYKESTFMPLYSELEKLLQQFLTTFKVFKYSVDSQMNLISQSLTAFAQFLETASICKDFVYQNSPLLRAVYEGKLDETLELAEQNTEFLNSYDINGVSPLIAATKKAGRAKTISDKAVYVKILKLLLEKGTDVMHADKSNSTALHYASMYCDLEVVDLLKASGADFYADPNIFNDTPILNLFLCEYDFIISYGRLGEKTSTIDYMLNNGLEDAIDYGVLAMLNFYKVRTGTVDLLKDNSDELKVMLESMHHRSLITDYDQCMELLELDFLCKKEFLMPKENITVMHEDL